MQTYPDIPPVADVSDELLDSGHLWLLEKIDGAQLRFQLRSSGLLRFGDEHLAYDDAEALPLASQHAVRHVRERLDRDALRTAVEDVEDVVFFGVATQLHGIEYDWERMPSFLGFDVWSTTADAFRPPDAVDGIFERLGLQSVNPIDRELPTRDFDPESYSMPDSAWYDGPAAGVVIRNKRGQRAQLTPEEPVASPPEPVSGSPGALAEQFGTRERFERVANTLAEAGQPVTVDAVRDRVLETIAREEHARLDRQGGLAEQQAFRSALGTHAQAFLSSRAGGEHESP
jgi:hypothetical protein